MLSIINSMAVSIITFIVYCVFVSLSYSFFWQININSSKDTR